MKTKELETVAGIVEMVGTKFNGSVKVNGTFYNFKKGFTSPVKQGDTVVLYLEKWEYSGKSGVNVVKIEIGNVKSSKEPETKPKVVASMSKDEWADKDRRISRQGCIQVAVQLKSKFEDAALLADKMLEYVNQK